MGRNNGRNSGKTEKTYTEKITETLHTEREAKPVAEYTKNS